MSDLPKILKGEVPSGHEGVFRPLRGILYYIYSSISTSPTLFHLHSIFVNFICSILIYLIASKIFKNKFLGFLVGIIFAAHPVHTEAITYISASMDTIGFIFMLFSFYLYLLSHSCLHKVIPAPFVIPAKAGIHTMLYRYRSSIRSRMTLYIGSIIFAFLAFFTYEMTLTLPLLIVLYDIVILRAKPEGSRFFTSFRMTLKRSLVYLPYFLALGFYLMVRLLLVGISGRASYPGDSLYIGFLVTTKVIGEYLKIILFPLNLAHNHILGKNLESFIYRGYNFEKFKELSVLNLDILSYIIIYIIILIISLKTFKKYPVISFCLGAFLILILPASGIVPQGSVMNERLIYLASFPIIFLLVWILNKLLRNKTVLLAACLGISLIFALLTYQRNLDWRNEIALWTKEISITPRANAYAYFQLGNALRSNGEYFQAAENFKKSYEINPYFSVAKASEAQIYDITGNETQAIRLYQAILSKDPYFWEAYRELGKIYLMQQKFNEAKKEFEKILLIYPNNPDVLNLIFTTQKLREESK